ncbi:SDR family oxidoreductase [uncultured Proteiniphilum sp.]|uniref:SDR family NAD(P)-dependent oxidoreductase n=1 Tax=uncultured Proteiniphilum sp. TaxID=497637 RepID=UPI002607BA4D|nr:SDR family oxidoreductase [uncultured Proteiniphilum sp.]
MQSKYNLSGKTALITGGGQGIGKSIVLGLAEAGADVIINYRSNTQLAEETAEEVKSLGREVWLWPFDLAQEDVLENYQKFISENHCPSVDILVANASHQIRNPWERVTSEEFALQMNVNVRSTLFLIQGVVPHMKVKKWGRILNIGSVQEKRPHPDMCVYAASKGALSNLVINLAPQLAPLGITVNSLAPGAIGTARNITALSNPEYLKKTVQKIPLGYIGEPDDCAQLVLLLCSEAGRYITGCNYFVDGGMSLLF